MCLDTVGRTVTLKRDRMVWKVVRLGKNKELPLVQEGCNFLSARKHISDRKNKIFTEYRDDEYIPYFHCFTTKAAAGAMGKCFTHSWSIAKHAVLEFIIPADTIVLYGKQAEISHRYTTIVTPVLINPRVKETK